MINPNQTKSVFWLIIIIVVLALAAGAYLWYRKHKATTPAVEEPSDTEEPADQPEAEV